MRIVDIKLIILDNPRRAARPLGQDERVRGQRRERAMPMMQAMVERANQRFNRENIEAIQAQSASLGAGTDLAAGARALGIAADRREEEFLRSWPGGIKEAIRAAVYDALMRPSGPLPVQFTWAPGYDYEVTVWEVAGTAESMGGMTIALKSPVPGR